MRKLRELRRLKYEARLPQRAIAQACGVGLGNVTAYLQRATAAGPSWPIPVDPAGPSRGRETLLRFLRRSTVLVVRHPDRGTPAQGVQHVDMGTRPRREILTRRRLRVDQAARPEHAEEEFGRNLLTARGVNPEKRRDAGARLRA